VAVSETSTDADMGAEARGTGGQSGALCGSRGDGRIEDGCKINARLLTSGSYIVT